MVVKVCYVTNVLMPVFNLRSSDECIFWFHHMINCGLFQKFHSVGN